MQSHEYIAIPAPRKGVSSKGVKGVPAKFANAVSILMNEMAAEGWEYQRSDTLPCEERQGLTGKTIKYHAMLVFRRSIETEANDSVPLALPVPDEEEVSEEIIEDVTEVSEDIVEQPEEETLDEFPDKIEAIDSKVEDPEKSV